MKNINDIIKNVLNDIYETRDLKLNIDEFETIKLMGEEALLDSMGLVTFLIELEQEINIEYNSYRK